MFNFHKSPITFSQKHIKVFIGTFIAMFLIVALQLSGIRVPKLVKPTPKEPDVFFEKIQPELEKKPNSYRLQKQSNLISQADAGDTYEQAAAYAVIDYETGQVLASKNLSSSIAIASLTKIMTSVVALDLADPSEYFTVSRNASSMIPTKIGVVAGEKMSVKELLHAALMTSANDAVEVIREGVDEKYDGQVFVRAMNEKAKYLGLQNTSFANPQGFDSMTQFSSAEDLGVLTRYALESYPLIAEIVKKDYVLLPKDAFHKQFDLYNWNGLIGVYPNVYGMKIGSTGAAGKTTVVIAQRSGKKIMAIVLGAPGVLERDLWAADLLDLGFEKRLGLAAVDVTEEKLRVKYATWKYWN